MPRQISARTVLGVAGWFAAAAVATTVGVVAVSAIGTDIVGETARPLSHDEVTRALATARPVPTPSASPTTPAATASPPAGSKVLGTPGGTVVARCENGLVTLVSWSPRQGYRSDHVRAEGGREASLRFESDRSEVRVRVDCRGGVPTAHIRTEDDD
ncbi:MAG TPA: hypothetical protein VF053_17985 [Streptosporangiales bacterium]